MKIIGNKNDSFGIVKKDKEYIVLGILVDKRDRKLSYLVSYFGDWPFWELSENFDVLDSDILPDWHIKMYNEEGTLSSLFCLSGFDELCNNKNYFEALLEREKWALDVYCKKHEEAIEWYQVKPFMTKKASLW